MEDVQIRLSDAQCGQLLNITGAQARGMQRWGMVVLKWIGLTDKQAVNTICK